MIKTNLAYAYCKKKHKRSVKGKLWQYDGMKYNAVPFYNKWYWYTMFRLAIGDYSTT